MPSINAPKNSLCKTRDRKIKLYNDAPKPQALNQHIQIQHTKVCHKILSSQDFKMRDIFRKAIDIILYITGKVIDEMIHLLGKFKEKVEDIAVDRAAEATVDTGASYFGMGSEMQSLARNLKALSSRASDVKETVETAELSGRQRRKTEVKDWLEEVEKLEIDFISLQRRAEEGTFWTRLMVGSYVRKMQDRVASLTDQSRNFNGLLLDNQENGGTTVDDQINTIT